MCAARFSPPITHAGAYCRQTDAAPISVCIRHQVQIDNRADDSDDDGDLRDRWTPGL
jgi:hypothetical protein